MDSDQMSVIDDVYIDYFVVVCPNGGAVGIMINS